MKKILTFIFIFLCSIFAYAQNDCQEFLDLMHKALKEKDLEKAKSEMKAFVNCKENNSDQSTQNLMKNISKIEYFTDFNKDGYSIAKRFDGKFIVIDKKYNEVKILNNVINANYPFKNKFALVQFKDESTGFIDKDGNELILKNSEHYIVYEAFEYGKAIVRLTNSYGIIDENGTIIYKINDNQDIWLEKMLSPNLVKIVVDSRRNGAYNKGVGILDIGLNKILINPKSNNYDAIIDFNPINNLVMLSVFNSSQACYADNKAKVSVIDLSSNEFIFKDYCLAFEIGKVPNLYASNKDYIILKDGKFQIYSLNSNSFKTREYFDDFNTNKMIDFYFNIYKKRFLKIKKNNSWSDGILYDKEFNIIELINTDYDDIDFSYNNFIVKKGNKYGLINNIKNILIPIDFDKIEDDISIENSKTIRYICRKNNPFQEYIFEIDKKGNIIKKKSK